MATAAPYTAFPNRFRRDLIAGKRLIGCWCRSAAPSRPRFSAWPASTGCCSTAEHAPNDVLSLVPQLMALKDSVSAPVVRPAVQRHGRDQAPARRRVPQLPDPLRRERGRGAPCRGGHALSARRRARRLRIAAEQSLRHGPRLFQGRQRQPAVLVQIESRAGVAAAASIAAVDGVDGLFIGPSDLAAGFGHLGNASHPEVQQAMAAIFAAAKAAGKPMGILAPVEADARRYLEWARPSSPSAERPRRPADGFAGAARQVSRAGRRADRGPVLTRIPFLAECNSEYRIHRTRHHGYAHGRPT